MKIQRKNTIGTHLATALFLAASTASFSHAASSDNGAIELSIDTPILELLEAPVARAIVEKHLPNLVKALDEDYDIADFLGSSSLKELSIDDDHVGNFDEEMLARLDEALAAARAESGA